MKMPYQFESYTTENRAMDDSSNQEETPVDCEHGSRLGCIEWWACLLFSTFFFLFSFFFFSQGKIFTGHFKRHFVPQISSQSLKQSHILRTTASFGNMGENTIYFIYFLADISSWETCTVTRNRSNIWKGYTHNKGQKYGTKPTFCSNCWVYALRMTQFRWFWWHSWPTMAY